MDALEAEVASLREGAADMVRLREDAAATRALAAMAERYASEAAGRTVPFAMIVQSIVITWFASADGPADVTGRATARPWYRIRAELSLEDMIAHASKKTFGLGRWLWPVARPTSPGIRRGHPHPVASTCALTGGELPREAALGGRNNKNCPQPSDP